MFSYRIMEDAGVELLKVPLDLWTTQQHQIGGFPVILNPQEMTCPICAQGSPFFANICDSASEKAPSSDDAAPHDTFTDNAGRKW